MLHLKVFEARGRCTVRTTSSKREGRSTNQSNVENEAHVYTFILCQMFCSEEVKESEDITHQSSCNFILTDP